MRKLFTLALFGVVCTAMARNIIVTGNVVDSKTNEGIDFATVQIMKGDSMVAGTTTRTDGGFSLEAPAGNYEMRISYVSYKSIKQNLKLVENLDSMKLGALKMESSDISLHTAVVTATAARVEQKGDTTQFNASAYRVPEGSTLEALIEQLPGVEVSEDGTITWNGKTVSEFLINGKDFFKGDTKIAMKNLPTELISKIKAYDKQSEYTEQTGIDDGEETTVLDLTTKKELNESWITNLDLAYGTHDRYAERFFGTRFTDNSRVTAFGSANNTGDRGFGGGGPRFRGGGRSGQVSSQMAGLDFNWQNGKKAREDGRLEVGGNIRYFHSSTDLQSESNSETFLTSGSNSSFANSRSRTLSGSTSVNTSLMLKWNPDSMSNFNFRPSYSFSKSNSHGTTLSATFNDNPYDIDNMQNPLDSVFRDNMQATTPIDLITVNSNLRHSMSESKSHNISGSMMYIRRFGNKGRNISLRATGSYQTSQSTSFSLSQITYFQDPSITEPQIVNQYNDDPTKNYSYSIRGGYAEPLGNNWFAQINYNFSYQYNDRSRSLYDLSSYYSSFAEAVQMFGIVPTDADILDAYLDERNSQYATYKYYKHRASIGVRYNTKEIRFNASVEFNPQKTVLDYTRPAQLDTTVTRHVFYVSPRVRFRYNFTQTGRIDIDYRGSASQPSMTDLLDITDDSDPLNISKGNPNLKPSWTNSLRAMFNNYNPDRQQGMMAAITAKQTSNSISNAMIYDEATGVRTVTPRNINGEWSARGDFMFNTGLGEEKTFTISTFTNASYNNNVGYVSTSNAAGSQKNTTRVLNLNERLNIGYRASWFNIGLNGSFNYQHSRSKLQENANLDTYTFAYGANANFNFDWGMSISTDLSMNSRRGYTDDAMNTNEFIWNIQISQSFLKNKNATISLQYFDILNQQSNISRTINAQMRQDAWTNAINSYGMIHFIYKLNIFGGKMVDQKNNSNRPMRAPMMMMMGGARGGHF